MSDTLPGRACPLDYRYGAQAIAAAPAFEAETLYVVGGLYGNLAALDEIERMAAAERGPVSIFFNGDFNWFNVNDASFAEINRRVLNRAAIAGNVEAELARGDDAAGCGCAYPDSVEQATVERSNEIHARLRDTAARHPAIVERLAALPRLARCHVGDLRVGIVHGDADWLAGWRFGIDALDRSDAALGLPNDFHTARVDVFACSHTCLPVMREVPLGVNNGLVANNGAAGMPNFLGERCGVITRISRHHSPVRPLYATSIGDTRIEALPVRYDTAHFARAFLADWPPGTPAHDSYWTRIESGTALPVVAAMPCLAGQIRPSVSSQGDAPRCKLADACGESQDDVVVPLQRIDRSDR